MAWPESELGEVLRCGDSLLNFIGLFDNFASCSLKIFIFIMHHFFSLFCQSTSQSHIASSLEKQIGESFNARMLSF